MPHHTYMYSDSLLTAVHRAMWTPLLLTHDIGGRRGNACEREEVREGGSDRIVTISPNLTASTQDEHRLTTLQKSSGPRNPYGRGVL